MVVSVVITMTWMALVFMVMMMVARAEVVSMVLGWAMVFFLMRIITWAV